MFNGARAADDLDQLIIFCVCESAIGCAPTTIICILPKNKTKGNGFVFGFQTPHLTPRCHTPGQGESREVATEGSCTDLSGPFHSRPIKGIPCKGEIPHTKGRMWLMWRSVSFRSHIEPKGSNCPAVVGVKEGTPKGKPVSP